MSEFPTITAYCFLTRLSFGMVFKSSWLVTIDSSVPSNQRTLWLFYCRGEPIQLWTRNTKTISKFHHNIFHIFWNISSYGSGPIRPLSELLRILVSILLFAQYALNTRENFCVPYVLKSYTSQKPCARPHLQLLNIPRSWRFIGWPSWELRSQFCLQILHYQSGCPEALQTLPSRWNECELWEPLWSVRLEQQISWSFV